MLELYVDPYVLACPAGYATENDVDNFVERLLILRDLEKAGVVALFVSDQSFNVLESTGSYPVGDRTQRFSHQQRRDVLQVVQKLLGEPSVEAACHVEDLLVEHPTCSPDGQLAGRLPQFVYHYHRLHAMIDLSESMEPGAGASPVVYTTGIPNGLATVHATGTVPMCIRRAACALPLEYTVDVLNVTDLQSVSMAIDPVAEWCSGSIANALSTALAARGYSFQPGSGGKRSWSLGPKFESSADECGFIHERGKARRLLDACVDSILDENLRDVHELRVGHGANTAQRVRVKDGAGAWRRDVDDEFHLHYWRSPNGVELASVGVHNNFTIPE